ncbi:DUF5060 domain-containing protein [uncultured Arcticibacterium sp.]|uniref:Kelch repeat-containing protein n=1 Tax=uncultured Arcticibacterium sp. TaxID=2173042 RepID=UPI0030F81CF5
MRKFQPLSRIFGTLGFIFLVGCVKPQTESWQWRTLSVNGEPVARHEAGLVAHESKIYLLGGRRINETSVFDPATNSWESKSETPIELHHFQPVSFGGAIYIVGAMTGQWPNEKPLYRVVIYHPEKDKYEFGHTIPEDRRRGGAGAVVYKNKIYVVGGITNGHMDGSKAWLDAYDPKTGEWEVLEDAPSARDHFQAVAVNDKLYAFGGRNSSRRTGEDMSRTIQHGNIYDFIKDKWQPVTSNLALPTQRAGSFTFAHDNLVLIGGGEQAGMDFAQNEVEAFNTETETWEEWPSFNRGRHGTGFAVVGDYVYIASGCGKPGGEPELKSVERLLLPKKSSIISAKGVIKTPVYTKFNTVTLAFEGPQTSESAADNPFLNYRLLVEFKHNEGNQIIRGFYAADGNAAETSEDAGAIWNVRFTPDKIGDWTYRASLEKGENIALSNDENTGAAVSITNSEGKFIVVPSDKDEADFRAKGRLVASEGFFKFSDTNKYWMKMGTNSPENLLAYEGFDGTFRISAEESEGEATASDELHKYENHEKDWKLGDPNWQNGKGKSIIGAMNYLASKGMNTVYFLSMNILGDGKDVWPYTSEKDFTRFDVSKLEQWQVLFDHMQSKGLLLHVVVQETENETMLDGGDTGPMRKLYFNELIARFGHNLGLVWNLGEENGPASWSPDGQNDIQRKAMAKYLKENDPYNHPVLLHTHSEDPLRSDILEDIVGYKYVDGLSLQQAERTETAEVIEHWKKEAKEMNHEWLITMDEIGKWHTGAVMDEENPGHDSLRHYVLWGSLMSGAAGVEWYFGAKHPHNDLTSEDWRKRDQLWELSNHARVFFENYIPYWDMTPAHHLINQEEAYCFVKPSEFYAVYLPKKGEAKIDLTGAIGNFTMQWYDPLKGGELQNGSLKNIKGGSVQSLGNSPNNKEQDWVVLIKK